MGRLSLLVVILLILVSSVTMVAINQINVQSAQGASDYAHTSEANTLANSSIEEAINEYLDAIDDNTTSSLLSNTFTKQVNNKEITTQFRNVNADNLIDTINIVSTVRNVQGKIYDRSAAHMVVSRKAFNPNGAIEIPNELTKFEGPGTISGEHEDDTTAGISTPDTSTATVEEELNILPEGNPVGENKYEGLPPSELAEKYIAEADFNLDNDGDGELTGGNYGTESDPSIVYASGYENGKDLELKDTDLSGNGILVIEGDFETKENAQFDWNGLVIISDTTGDGTNVELQGNDKINGSLIVGGDDNVEDKVELKEGDGSSGGSSLLDQAIDKTQELIDKIEATKSEYPDENQNDLLGQEGDYLTEVNTSTEQLRTGSTEGSGLLGAKSYFETVRDGFANDELTLEDLPAPEKDVAVERLLVGGKGVPTESDVADYAGEPWFNRDWKSDMYWNGETFESAEDYEGSDDILGRLRFRKQNPTLLEEITSGSEAPAPIVQYDPDALEMARDAAENYESIKNITWME